MARWIEKPARVAAGLAMAGVLAGAAALHGRRRRRNAAPPALSRQTARAGEEQAAEADGGEGEGESAPDEAKPLLKPLTFAVSHFGLLVVLLGMMTVGLALRGIERYPPPTTFHVNGGDAGRGRQAMMKHGCGGCHEIPGVPGAGGQVGPGLAGFGQRMYIAGQLPNTPEHLMAWLQDPPKHAPGTAMPDLGVTEPESRDMAAFLYQK